MNIPNSLDKCLGGKMQCFYCGKNVEDIGVERQGHTFCNNLCRYSFEKSGSAPKSQSFVVETSKTDDVNKTNKIGDNKLHTKADECAQKQYKTHNLQTCVDNKESIKASSKSVFDNNYIKIVFAVLSALLIYRSISNYIDQKQTEALIKDLDKTMIQIDRNMGKFKINKH
jgi:hypothetical protein